MFSVQPVFSTRFSRHGDGYRCRRGGRERTHAYVRTKDTRPTANACVRVLVPSARKSRIIILLAEWKRNRVRISMNGIHETRPGPESLLSSRPGLHLHHAALCPFFLSPLLPSSSSTFLYISSGLPPSIRQPRVRTGRIEFTASCGVEEQTGRR